ncbi:FecR family protein [Seramator thermalis]|uniref:FecR family protein n=1 Tax=Seramator thermalis TaxID=2496270 RepID=UPI00101D5748|nr:FecR family protein [Seramator thermalis]
MNKDLLYRFFDGTATIEEEESVRNWIESSDDNYADFLRERKIYDALLLSTPSKISRQSFHQHITPWIVSTVASIALLVIATGLFFYAESSKSQQYNTIIVPPGQRINLILADNTNVWLNANTTFRYPSKFARKNREVFLDGEAWFDVSKNKKKPFIVKTDQGEVRVTGTTFNLEAYSEYKNFVTSLFEGSVDIYQNNTKLATLKPNQKGMLQNDHYFISTIDNTDEYLWRDGLIAFDNMKLEDILFELEKYFDIQIEINTKKLPQHRYTGKFRQADGVDYALRVLQKSIHFSYNRDDEKQIIYIN